MFTRGVWQSFGNWFLMRWASEGIRQNEENLNFRNVKDWVLVVDASRHSEESKTEEINLEILNRWSSRIK